MATNYRKISCLMWNDAKFRKLSSTPSSKMLFIWLLTGPQTTQIPGLMTIGKAAAAELLGWKVRDFDGCFSELQRLGLAIADWDALVVWLPNAVKHNHPASIKNVICWASATQHIPESELTDAAIYNIHAYLHGASKEWGDKFKAVCNEVSRPVLDGASYAPYDPINMGHAMSETETVTGTETETEAETVSVSGTVVCASKAARPRKAERNFDYDSSPDFCRFWQAYPRKKNKGDAFEIWQLMKPPIAEVLHAISWMKQTDEWKRNGGQFIRMPITALNQRFWEDEPPEDLGRADSQKAHTEQVFDRLRKKYANPKQEMTEL